MKLKYYALIFVGLICLSAVTDAKAQVSVTTSSPANGAALEVRSTDKGFLIPRVTLTGTDDNTTITPAATTGLIVFNTTPAGSGATRVEQGFYFWTDPFNFFEIVFVKNGATDGS